MDQSLPTMSPANSSPEPLFKNPLVIIALIIFIVALVMAGLGWWLKNNNLAPANNSSQPLSEAEQMKLLQELQASASSTPQLSSEEQAKLLKELQASAPTAPSLSAEEQLKLLKSLQQQ